MRWLTGYIQCDEKYKSQIKAQAKERGKMTTAERDCLYGVYPLALFVAGTIFTLVAGTVLAIGYAFARETELMFRSIFFLIVMPFAIMYVLLLLYNMLAMAASREAFAVLSRGEKAATLAHCPLLSPRIHPHLYRQLLPTQEKGAHRLGRERTAELPQRGRKRLGRLQ